MVKKRRRSTHTYHISIENVTAVQSEPILWNLDCDVLIQRLSLPCQSPAKRIQLHNSLPHKKQSPQKSEGNEIGLEKSGNSLIANSMVPRERRTGLGVVDGEELGAKLMVGLEQAHPHALRAALPVHGVEDGASDARHQQHRVRAPVTVPVVAIVLTMPWPQDMLDPLHYLPHRDSQHHLHPNSAPAPATRTKIRCRSPQVLARTVSIDGVNRTHKRFGARTGIVSRPVARRALSIRSGSGISDEWLGFLVGLFWDG
jgi:hypothetical protein